MAAVNYYGGYLSPESVEMMEKLLPDTSWKNHYNPYTADPYLFWTGTEFLYNLTDVPTSKVLRLYANTLVHNPYLVTRDRLCGSELLWDVTMAKGSFNYIYFCGIDSSNLGFVQPKNNMQPVMTKYLDYTAEHLAPVLWRPGLYNILLALLLLSFVKHSRKYIFIFLPVIGTNLSLLIAQTHQSFRYVYYIPLVFGFIWLLAISKAIRYTNNNTISK